MYITAMVPNDKTFLEKVNFIVKGSLQVMMVTEWLLSLVYTNCHYNTTFYSVLIKL